MYHKIKSIHELRIVVFRSNATTSSENGQVWKAARQLVTGSRGTCTTTLNFVDFVPRPTVPKDHEIRHVSSNQSPSLAVTPPRQAFLVCIAALAISRTVSNAREKKRAKASNASLPRDGELGDR